MISFKQFMEENYYGKLAKHDRDVEQGWDNDKKSFKRDEMEYELGHETNGPKTTYTPRFGMMIDGKLWKKDGQPVSFTSRVAADKSAATIAARGKQTKVIPI